MNAFRRRSRKLTQLRSQVTIIDRFSRPMLDGDHAGMSKAQTRSERRRASKRSDEVDSMAEIEELIEEESKNGAGEFGDLTPRDHTPLSKKTADSGPPAFLKKAPSSVRDRNIIKDILHEKEMLMER